MEGATTDSHVVVARGLVKRFGSSVALDGLDLDLCRGEVLGFLGPNGSGKTTTLRVLLGQLRLDGGEASVFGLDPWNDATTIHERLAYVPGDVNLWPGLTGGECIDALLSFHGSCDRVRRDALIERFDLDPTKRARTYSKGNRQKVALVAALATDAELLVLDEPTSGLDPLMEAQFQDVVRESGARGQTVLLSSHILSEVEALCDRVAIIRRGRTVSSGTLAELRAHTLTTVQATASSPIDGVAALTGVVASQERAVAGGTRITARVHQDAVTDVLARLTAAGAVNLVVQPPSLDELFLAEYRDRPEPAA